MKLDECANYAGMGLAALARAGEITEAELLNNRASLSMREFEYKIVEHACFTAL